MHLSAAIMLMYRNYISFQCFEKTWLFLYKKRLVVTDDLSCEKTTVQKGIEKILL